MVNKDLLTTELKMRFLSPLTSMLRGKKDYKK